MLRSEFIATLPALKKPEMGWYYGRNEEYLQGPFDSREQAIAEGRGDYGDDVGFSIFQGGVSSIDMTAHIDVSELIERMDDCGDYLSGEGRDTVADGVATDALDDLERRICRVVREWQVEQEAAGHVIRGDYFTSTLHEEAVLPRESEDGAA